MHISVHPNFQLINMVFNDCKLLFAVLQALLTESGHLELRYISTLLLVGINMFLVPHSLKYGSILVLVLQIKTLFLVLKIHKMLFSVLLVDGVRLGVNVVDRFTICGIF